MPRAAVAGAGIAGRLSALLLCRAGWKVSLFELSDKNTLSGAAQAAGGMLAPYTEREHAESIVMQLGHNALRAWPHLLASLNQPVAFAHRGSLIVSYPEDRPQLLDFRDKLEGRGLRDQIDRDARLSEIEPGLAGRFVDHFVLNGEAHLDPRQVLSSLQEQLEIEGVSCHWLSHVEAATPGEIVVNGERQGFDLVIDARGLGMCDDHKDLRGVRGEALIVHAPEVTISRPVRLVHPRIPVYIIPRSGHRYYLGASSIESDSDDPISIRTAVELMSAAVAVHPGFAEASILELVVGVRPALPNNLPRLRCDRKGLIAILGLFRHGFLLAPEVAATIVALASHKLDIRALDALSRSFVEEWQFERHH